jgi:hypothetical protein
MKRRKIAFSRWLLAIGGRVQLIEIKEEEKK